MTALLPAHCKLSRQLWKEGKKATESARARRIVPCGSESPPFLWMPQVTARDHAGPESQVVTMAERGALRAEGASIEQMNGLATSRGAGYVLDTF